MRKALTEHHLTALCSMAVRRFLPACLFLLAFGLPSWAQTSTVSGDLKTVGVTNATAPGTYVRFTLQGFGSNIPRVTGTGVIAQATYIFRPSASGVISGTIYRTDFITPSSTFYNVCIFDQGQQFRCANYLVTASTFNLNSASPISSAPSPPAPFSAVVTNPTGTQNIAQPSGTELQINGVGILAANICVASIQTTSTAGVMIAACITALPASGGTVLADLEGAQTVATDVFTSVTKNVHIIWTSGQYTFSANTTFPKNITNELKNGAQWHAPTGVTITVSGPFDAPQTTVLTWAGTGKFVFNNTPSLNIKWWGAVGDGVADDTAEIQANFIAAQTVGVESFIPFGNYLVTSTLTIDEPGPIKIRGQIGAATTNRRAILTANFTDAVIKRATGTACCPPMLIENLTINNTHASGEGIELNVTADSVIANNHITAYRAIIVDQSNFGTEVRTNDVNGLAANPAGSIGIFCQNHTTIINNDVVGFDHGYRLSGAGVAVLGGRTEVNVVGFMLGQDISGISFALSESFLGGLRGEANDTFIYAFRTVGVVISGAGAQGSVGAPSGQSQRILRILDADQTLFNGINCSGTYDTVGIEVAVNAVDSAIMNTTCSAAGAIGGGVAWLVNTTDPSTFNFINTDYPDQWFAVENRFFLTGDVSPAQLTGNQNNYNPTSLATASVLRLDSDASRTITGLAGGADGRIITLLNVGANNIVLANASGSSTAANQFLFGADATIAPNSAMVLIYDSTSSRWRGANLNASSLNGATMAAPGAIGGGTPAAGTFTTLTATGALTAETFNSETNCSSSASPAVCADAAAGSVVIAAAATSVVVNTTKVTANSQIIITEDSSLGTKLSVTCNTTLARNYAITARTAGTSFVITTDVAPVTNPACLSYWIVN